MTLEERNALRMKVWDAEEQIRSQLQIPERYRNHIKIEELHRLVRSLEEQISQA